MHNNKLRPDPDELERRLEITNDPRFRQKRAEVAAWVADRRIKAADSAEARVGQLLSLESEAFIELLVNTNRVLTNTHEDEFDTDFMTPLSNMISDPGNPGYIQLLPHPEDKKDLLLHLHALAQDMQTLNKSPGHIAAVIGYGINLIHPFIDANGRTARTVHNALVYGTVAAGERFSRVSNDSLDNTDAMNPEPIESYVYQRMQLQNNTHQVLPDGSLVPRIILTASDSTLRSIWARTTVDDTVATSFEHLLLAIMHKEINPMLAYAMAENHKNPVVGNSLDVCHGQYVLKLDIFSQLAEAKEWDMMQANTRQISAAYAMNAMHILAAHPDDGDELTVTINTREQGPINLQISEVIQKLAQHELHREAWPTESNQ